MAASRAAARNSDCEARHNDRDVIDDGQNSDAKLRSNQIKARKSNQMQRAVQHRVAHARWEEGERASADEGNKVKAQDNRTGRIRRGQSGADKRMRTATRDSAIGLSAITLQCICYSCRVVCADFVVRGLQAVGPSFTGTATATLSAASSAPPSSGSSANSTSDAASDSSDRRAGTPTDVGVGAGAAVAVRAGLALGLRAEAAAAARLGRVGWLAAMATRGSDRIGSGSEWSDWRSGMKQFVA